MNRARGRALGIGLAAASTALVAALLLRGESAGPRAEARATLAIPPPVDELPAPALPPADEIERDVVEAPRRRAAPIAAPMPQGATPERLARAHGWMDCLWTHERLPRLGPDGELARLQRVFEDAKSPVVRQNLVFLAVLTLPAAISRPWLREIAAGEDPEDADDALVALAFDGDANGRAAFARLAAAPSPAPVRRLIDTLDEHEALGDEATKEARAVLRSYRAIEVLDRKPYFKATFVYARGVDWVAHPDPSPELRLELLPRWIAHYPGHPGSDDMALRIGRRHTERGDHYAAARWYARAASFPDQDVTGVALQDLVATCEFVLEPAELGRLAHEQGYVTPNRTLVQYIRLRRIAADESLDRAVRLAAALGRDEPESSLGHAWNDRFAAAAPKGLDSGVQPLADDDPLRVVAEPLRRPETKGRPSLIDGSDWHAWPDEKRRLDPEPEALRLRHDYLALQFRAWETLTELERRAARTRDGARADLLYKQAAIFYHDRRVLVPVYGSQSFLFRHVFYALPEKQRCERLNRFEKNSYGLLRGIELFDRIVRDHPRWAGLDKVYFSQGLAWKKLLTYRPYMPYYVYREDEKRQQRTVIRNAAAALETCAARFPESPLAPSAVLAAAYWRRTRPDAFR